MSEPLNELQPAQQGRRRRYTANQKRALLDDAAKPGGSISETARRYSVAPSLLFQWRKVMDDATKKGLNANEQVVPRSELKKAKARIRELERMLGKQTMKVEILEEAVAIAREKSGSRAATRPTKAVDGDRRRCGSEDLAAASVDND